ncbi:ATP-binding cassette domain-containing protein, partial [Bradyrhizobium sp. CCBAU 21360]|uniref:ATP-binding cassette domain-containing protein n=1 Tax=Bradyrhizobium sp. CCBAU 21360 TaxID=1325081 RepID=UPI00230681DD
MTSQVAADTKTGSQLPTFANPAAVLIEHVSKWYGAFQVLKDVSLDVAVAERVVVCGPSGSGKSTLIRCINQLETHQSGRIVVNGIELCPDMRGLAAVRRDVGM